MTPTYKGRIQTRIFLTILIGLPIGLLWGVVMNNLIGSTVVVALSLLIGLLLDPFYNFIQNQSWDADWPPVLMVLSGILEGSVLWFVTQIFVPHLTSTGIFLMMYSSIWLAIFFAQLTIIGIFFPYRRFKGGALTGKQ